MKYESLFLYLTYADCVVRFLRDEGKTEKTLWIFEYFPEISENMHARCVREDTKQALKGNLQADGVQKSPDASLCGIAFIYPVEFPPVIS